MLEVGQVVSHYRLQKRLGRNAGRQTWLAEDIELTVPHPVVVKLLAFGGDVQWEDLKLFEREAQVLKQLDHPRIPKYRDYFSLDERTLWFALVQEYIPGTSLKALLQHKRLTEPQVVIIAKGVLETLQYLHSLHPAILHRDIKPSNLILSQDQQVYLVDFGSVQDRAVAEGATFTVVGTYGYTPIEQFGGRAVPASDLYALGASLIYLLTGTPPADLPTHNLKLQFRDRLPNSYLVNWLEKMTEPALENRFQTAQAALLMLNRLEQTPYSHTPAKAIQPTLNRLKQPLSSRVKLQTDPTKLQIAIPRREIQGLGDVSALIVFGLTASIFYWLFPAILMAFPLGLIILGVFCWFWLKYFHYWFCSTKVSFNSKMFLIEKFLLGFRYFRQQGMTQNIQDISLKYEGNGHSRLSGMMAREVVITSEVLRKSNRFVRDVFGEGLTEAELMWLAQVIRDWLPRGSEI